MIDEDVVATLAASREGFEPVACTPVALPAWRLQVRVELLARREISPLQEFVLRAALEADPRVGAIQALLGHKDVRTTMIYTHVVNTGALGALSPLDRLGRTIPGR